MKKNPIMRGGPGLAGCDTILTDLSSVIQDAPTSAARTVNAVMTAEYRPSLPSEKELSAEVKRTRALLEERRDALLEGDSE